MRWSILDPAFGKANLHFSDVVITAVYVKLDLSNGPV